MNLSLLLAVLLCTVATAQDRVYGGSVTGTIKDNTGAPQMGALVQLLAPDAQVIASAITDMQGRYHLRGVDAGRYLVRATQALYLPAQRENLQLTLHSRAIVDLTLATLMNPIGWLPAQRRPADESGDDWMWTLRSSANRPVLRVADDHDSASKVSYSSSAETQTNSATRARLSVSSDDGAFAHGGVHQAITFDRMQTDGSSAIVCADMSGARTPYPVAPSADLAVGFEKKMGFGNFGRTVLTYHSHPELVGANGSNGVQAATIRSAERIMLGDTVMIDAGSMLREINASGNALEMLPFIRVSVKPSEHVVLTYGYSRSNELQALDDLDRVEVEMPIAYEQNGRLRTARGSHQSLSLGTSAGRTVMEISVYSDKIGAAAIAGTGVLDASEVATGSMVADPTTQTFRALGTGYSSKGARLMVREQLIPSISIAGSYSTGSVLTAGIPTEGSAQALLATLHSTRSQTAMGSLNGRILHTGTRLRASYRWQPHGTLTAVNSFADAEEGAYLSLHARQPIRMHGILPDGLEAVVDISNLLEEGYTPFVSTDGRTLYFAQTPKTLQAGLAFTF